MPIGRKLYQNWLKQNRGISFERYEDLWQWSISDLDSFWQSIWDYFELQSPTPHTAVLAKNAMPGAVWFPGAKVNYASQVLRHVDAAHAAGAPASAQVPLTGSDLATGINDAKEKNSTAKYITNKLTVLQVNNTINDFTGSDFTVPITGGNITLSNNLTYLTPANLGVVNLPITYFTGTRSITGTLTA